MALKKNRVLVSLTGGLGNQLFQLAAGLNLAGKDNLYLVSTLGAPRKSLSRKAELLSFFLPERVEILGDKNASWITRKTAGFMLRKGVAPSHLERKRLFIILSRLLANIIMSLHFREKIEVSSLDGVGYVPINLTKSNTLLLGYFQSYRWADDIDVKSELSSMTYSQKNELIRQFVLESKNELPLIVHVRLGDYLSERDFGIPSRHYYKKGIIEILNAGKCKSLWLFSDDLKNALSYIPDDLSIPVRLMPEIEGSPAATLEVMRFGAGYVIANSSFSWWAAYLKRNEEAEVVAPTPWFSGMSEPVDLIPASWKRISAEFS